MLMITENLIKKSADLRKARQMVLKMIVTLAVRTKIPYKMAREVIQTILQTEEPDIYKLLGFWGND